ncbi:MAG TPA: hypothetical protein VKF84_02410 [Candidatus Sulfotelmatobacter sp.]|nr:hypothetical protein [Candidatus Sulfotelmatobacter sp.]
MLPVAFGVSTKIQAAVFDVSSVGMAFSSRYIWLIATSREYGEGSRKPMTSVMRFVKTIGVVSGKIERGISEDNRL